MPTDETALCDAFLRGEIDSREFHHVDHLHVAFHLLRRSSFPDAASDYCRALKAIAAGAGRPDAFHMTVTIAFLSLVAERLESTCDGDFDSFVRANPRVLEKNALEAVYPAERLNSGIARRTFILPSAVR